MSEPAQRPPAGRRRAAGWTIGDVSRLARVTVSALRYYHAQGLLVPDHVDGATGYRYYADGQIADALRLGVLRQLGVPLVDLRRLAEGRIGVDALLAEHRRRVVEDIERRRRDLALLDDVVEHQSAPVTRRRLGPCRVHGLRLTTTWDRAAQATRYGLSRLTVALRRAGRPVGPGQAPGALFPLRPLDRFELRVYRPAPEGGAPGDLPGDLSGGVESWVLPGGSALEVVHEGAHALLPYSARQLLAEVALRGLVADGPLRETYLDAGAGRLLTRLTVLIAETPATVGMSRRSG